jgi:DeoR family transcriptional regulator of aga operon
MAEVKTARLLGVERRRIILESVERDGRVTVDGLVDRFGVSAVTARADLDALATAGALVRSHGGAVRPAEPALDFPISVKRTQHHAEKVRIAKAAVQLIRADETILLDSGTTTAEIARQIRRQNLRLTVVTNALNVAMELGRAPRVSVIMLGGMLRPTAYSMVGPQAEQALLQLRADRLFLGVDALAPEMGFCTPDILEARLNALMIKVSAEVTAVADASKFQRRSLSVIGPIDRAHRLITDKAADPAIVAAVRARGVEVLLV